MDDSLDRTLRGIYGAYQYLHAHDLTDVSTTSQLLHARDLAFLARRAYDELDELRDTLAGTHGHGHGRDDVVLEAYQSLYWLLLLAVAAGDSYDDIRAHEVLTMDESSGSSVSADELRTLSWHADPSQPRDRWWLVRAGLARVAAQCRAAGIDVFEAVRRDERELRAKPYLGPYWSARDRTE